MNATAAVCFSPLCAYPLPAGGDAWEKIGVEELDLGRVGQQMKLVYPRGPERGGGKYGEGVPRTGHVESPLADKPRHRSSGGGLWFVVYGDATGLLSPCSAWPARRAWGNTAAAAALSRSVPSIKTIS